MSENAAFTEMETLDKLIVINHYINECSSRNAAMRALITKTRGLTAQMVDKQQDITTTAVVKEARSVDLSCLMERQKDKSKKGGDSNDY